MDTLQHQTYKDEIHSLQEEIRLLEQQSQNSHIYMGSFLKTMDIQQEKFSVQNSESWKCSNTDLEAQIEQAESQIALLTQLTGIGFTKCIMTTMGKGDDKRKQYRLSGYSHSLQFDLEFELMDVQTEENVITTVTELNVILESNEFCDLSRFISRTEEKKSLLLLFRTLSTFAKWYELRQVTFRHFKEKYPKVIRLPEGSNSEYMVLECSKVPGIELKIFWKIFVSEEVVVVPVLDLLTKVPAEALGLDTKKVVDNAPNSFRKLIRVFGIEAAIDHLIKLM